MQLTTEVLSAMDVGNGTTVGPRVVRLISYAVVDMIVLVNDFGISCPINLIGVFTNIANIIVFCRMGFSESSNINFFTLSVFDLLVSVFMFFTKLLNNRLMGIAANDASQSTGFALVVSIGGSAMMTALISTERYLCVVFPLKVKSLLTRRRSMYLMLTVVAYQVAYLVLLFVEARPPYRVYPEKIGFYIFYLYAVPTTIFFFLVLITTIYLVSTLRRKQKWRRETATQSDKSSNKENKLLRTIIAISTIFIVCAFPTVFVFMSQAIYPPFRYTDPYLGKVVLLIFMMSNTLQSVSSSVNIFFFYRMSSKYNKVFDMTFCRQKKEIIEKSSEN